MNQRKHPETGVDGGVGPPSKVRELMAMRPNEPFRGDALHRVVVVGGGAAGLELVTRLGDRLGRRQRARVTLVESSRTHLWKPMLHEVAAGSMDPGQYEVDYLAQAYWHGFHYRFGEMIGLDRATRKVQLAATFDDEGLEITPPRSVGYDTLVIAIGSVINDFGTPGVAEHTVPLETAAQAARFHRRLVNACIRCGRSGGAGTARPAPRSDRRRRRDGDGAGRRAPSHHT